MLQPISSHVPGPTGSAGTVRAAIFALAVLIGAKWVVGVAMAVANR